MAFYLSPIDATVPREKAKKVGGYAVTLIVGAALGGIAKAARTGMYDGTMAGIWGGAITAGLGSLASDAYQYSSDITNKTWDTITRTFQAIFSSS